MGSRASVRRCVSVACLAALIVACDASTPASTSETTGVRGTSSAPVSAATVATSAAPPSTTTSPTSSPSTVVTASAPATPTTPSSPTATLITRPYIDPALCGSGTKSVYTASLSAYFPFATAREVPIPLQVIAEAADGVARPFAVVLRHFAPDQNPPIGDPVVINGTTVNIKTFSNLNGQAVWTLPDGSTAYMRTRDLDQPAIEALVGRLTARPRTASIPGFDVAPSTDPHGLVLLHEHLNTDLSGSTTLFQCISGTTGYVYRVRAIEGDPVFVYFGIIDARRPNAVGVNGDGALTIEGGLAAASGPTLQDVTNADPTTWAAIPPP